ncbi:MAG TPA: cupin domain-containing protein [Gaiellaceae bacterium]|nr:cupin domain-containing protein [Gaiellaceae bacterium]
MNVYDVELQFDEDDPPGYHTAYLRAALVLGGEKIAFNVFELPAGQSVCPYHYECGEEEWIVVLTGRPTLRTPDGEQELGPWDCVFCPPGEAGAHKVTNHGDEPARIVIWSDRTTPGTSVYPDSQKVGAWPPGKLFRLADAVDYFDGEVS